MESMKLACIRLALNLVHQLGQDKETENIFISPHSISTAMSMVLLGSRNDSQQQLLKNFFPGVSENDVHKANGEIHKALIAAKDGVTLDVASSMFPESTYSILQEFSAQMSDHYKVQVQLMDYKQNAEESRKKINAWVESKTNEKIKDLLVSGTLTPRTKLVIANAVYFKGNWAKKFDSQLTTDDDFHLNTSDNKKVKMMKKKAKFPFYMDKEMKAVELDYDGDQVSMIVILPNEFLGLKSILSNLTPEKMELMAKEFTSNEDIVVKMPKLKIEYDADLVESFQALGVTDIFDEKRADLSGISGVADLYVTKVAHKAFIEINEEGTEAAAATAVVMMRRMAFLPPMEFVCNQPFLFIIKHKPSGVPLFLGKVCTV